MNKKTMHILVAQDEKFFFDLLKIQAAHEGAPLKLDWAANGRQAFEKIREGNDYDAILMNLEMPFMDGLMATRAIRGLGITIPIIAWTLYGEDEMGESCQAVGMNDFITIDGSRALEEVMDALRKCKVMTR